MLEMVYSDEQLGLNLLFDFNYTTHNKNQMRLKILAYLLLNWSGRKIFPTCY